jgi:ABC-2 type transport system permease protein
MNWMRIRELVRKEFIILFRDEKNRRVLIIAPIIQILIFGYVVNYDIKDIRVAIMDQARTSESRSLIKTFEGSKTFSITSYPEDPRGLEQLLLKGKVDIGIKIAPDMTSRIRKGRTADVQILADGSMSNMAAVRIAYTVMVLDTFNQNMIKEL